MTTWFCSLPNFDTMIATKYCSWHDNCAAVPYANNYWDVMTKSWISTKRNIIGIWILSQKPLVEWVPEAGHRSQHPDGDRSPNSLLADSALKRKQIYTWCSNALRWRHIERDGVSNHQPHDCLLKRLFRQRSKETAELRVTDLCAGNSPVAGEFPPRMASNAENVSVWWRHQGVINSSGSILYILVFTVTDYFTRPIMTLGHSGEYISVTTKSFLPAVYGGVSKTRMSS